MDMKGMDFEETEMEQVLPLPIAETCTIILRINSTIAYQRQSRPEIVTVAQ